MDGVYDIAQQVQDWSAEGRDVTVATVVATRGFSSHAPAATAAWTDGAAPVGGLVAGVEPATVGGTGLVEITLTEADALSAGLACGGTATLLVRRAADYPAELWPRLVHREPLCLVVDELGATMYTPETIRGVHGHADAVPRLFARGVTTAGLVDGVAVIACWPVPTLVVVGDGLIADALQAQAALLGWHTEITPHVDDAVAAVKGLHASDAVLVLSHDRAVDGPALTAALAGGAGYVGALGSRRTQAARREWLTGHGVLGKDQARIQGPAGLDIDAHTPAEIAVSIVAQVLANRAGASGGSLKERGGAVHVAGVQAPPPRY